jgi:hypothetical protein
VLAITSASGLPAIDGMAVSRATVSTLRTVPLEPPRIRSSSRISPVDRAPPSR